MAQLVSVTPSFISLKNKTTAVGALQRMHAPLPCPASCLGDRKALEQQCQFKGKVDKHYVMTLWSKHCRLFTAQHSSWVLRWKPV